MNQQWWIAVLSVAVFSGCVSAITLAALLPGRVRRRKRGRWRR